jgi:hypothetical protein
MDAIVYFLKNQNFSSSSRRSFNQEKLLLECIIEERDRIENFYKVLFRNNNSFNNNINKNNNCAMYEGNQNPTTLNDSLCFGFLDENKILLGDLSFPWNTIENFKTAAFSSMPTRSRQKYIAVTEFLCSNPSMAERTYDLHKIILEIISRVSVIKYPLSPSCVEKKRKTEKRSISYDYGKNEQENRSGEKVGELKKLKNVK